MIWFTSDLHVGHNNIIKYSNRPFVNVDEMNEGLIRNWNGVVAHDDTTYIIGDFSFIKDPQKNINILNRLNGTKYLVRGNHDEKLDKTVLAKFKEVYRYFELYVHDSTHPRGKQLIVLCHYAMRVWNQSHRGSWMLYGHSHNNLTDDPNSLSIDVGVDCFNYTPISYEQIKKIMSKKTWKSIDHHGDSKNDKI